MTSNLLNIVVNINDIAGTFDVLPEVSCNRVEKIENEDGVMDICVRLRLTPVKKHEIKNKELSNINNLGLSNSSLWPALPKTPKDMLAFFKEAGGKI
jgi:hypothetical protein